MSEPDLDDIAALGARAMQIIPEHLRLHCRDLVIRVADQATADELAELDIDDPLHLLGLYVGKGTPLRDSWDTGTEPDQVWLYRRPILAYVRETTEPLGRVVQHVLIHEIGHHFGFSDDDMDRIEADA